MEESVYQARWLLIITALLAVGLTAVGAAARWTAGAFRHKQWPVLRAYRKPVSGRALSCDTEDGSSAHCERSSTVFAAGPRGHAGPHGRPARL